jgi:prephenate dehydratase
LSAVPAVPDFGARAVVTFAIHSPSRLFEGEAANGKTYEFLLHRKIEDGKPRFFGLKLQTRSTSEKQHLSDGEFSLIASTAAMPQALKDAFAALREDRVSIWRIQERNFRPMTSF